MVIYVVYGLLIFLAIVFIIAFASMKNKKETIGFERNMKDGDIIKRLLKYLIPNIVPFIIALLLMLVASASDIILPIITGEITTELGEDTIVFSKIVELCIFGLICILAAHIASYFQAVVLQKTGQKIISTLRMDVFEHIEKLSTNQTNNIPVGKLVTRVANDTGAISNMFTNLIVNLLKNVVMIIGVFVAMLFINVKMALVVLTFTPFIVLYTLIFRKFSRAAFREVRNGITDMNTFLSENLSGIKVTQIFNQEKKKFNDFSRRNMNLRKSEKKEMIVFAIFRPAVYLLYISCMIMIFYVGSKDAISEASFASQIITYSTIVVFYQYINKFFTPIQNLAEQFNYLQSAFASCEKVFTILDMVPEIQDEEGAVELNDIRGEIEFKDVWFAYVPGVWVLKGISFKVNAKDTVAFVGATGSGKSTILSLIVRNYDIQKGQILIDGMDIKRIKVSSLRKHFGQMLQDVFIFSGTIRSNITLNETDVPEDEITSSCKYVNADHFINKLEHGLDEEVRERGNNFSSGQRQLLSFARTILAKPEVMILDEATANIDTETELLIQDSLEKMMNIGTMLMVAHRLSTIQHADKIIVMSHGEIIESGTHQELLALKGSYYNLYQLQYNKELLLSEAK